MNATATWATGKLTISTDGAAETFTSTKAPAFVVTGTGNPGTRSGIWFSRHATRQAALKARDARGEGTVLPVAVKLPPR